MEILDGYTNRHGIKIKAICSNGDELCLSVTELAELINQDISVAQSRRLAMETKTPDNVGVQITKEQAREYLNIFQTGLTQETIDALLDIIYPGLEDKHPLPDYRDLE